jgi:heme-degrading monooxygenase HmoA
MNTRRIAVAALAALATFALWAQNQPQLPVPDLVGPLKATPGCLGVETARTASGKMVIFAWFEDKKAVLRWYNSEIHQELMKMGGPPDPSHVPLAGIADAGGPILAVASLTMSNQPPKGFPMPVSQIAIELYQPLPGGVFVGGRFAPNSVKVPGMRDFSPSPSK